MPTKEQFALFLGIGVLLAAFHGLGGEAPPARPDEVFATWEAALALPGVQGLTVGRTLLYPEDGDVAGAVATAASLLKGHTVEEGAAR